MPGVLLPRNPDQDGVGRGAVDVEVLRGPNYRIEPCTNRAKAATFLVRYVSARTDETLVATVLGALLRAGEVPRADVVEKQLHLTPPSAHALAVFVPELHSYDSLVQEVVA